MGFSLNVAIADGIITATKGKANKEISYDTANASNIRSEIFDKKKQELNYMMNIGRKQIIYGAEIKGIPKRCINFSSKILYINFIMDFARNHR